ncbi:MAG: hypothetical protein ACN6NN_10915, partial [Acinetobacter calcoaceticus]
EALNNPDEVDRKMMEQKTPQVAEGLD